MVNVDNITLSEMLIKACDVILPKRRANKAAAAAAAQNLATSQTSETTEATELTHISIDMDMDMNMDTDLSLSTSTNTNIADSEINGESVAAIMAEPFPEMQMYTTNPGVTRVLERALYSLSGAATQIPATENLGYLRVFFSSAPVQTMGKYLAGIAHYRVCEDLELVLAYSYLVRFLRSMPAGSTFSFAHIRRIYMTCVALACKFHQDNPFNSYSFGFLMGIPVAQMNALEAALFRFFEYNMTPLEADVALAHAQIQKFIIDDAASAAQKDTSARPHSKSA